MTGDPLAHRDKETGEEAKVIVLNDDTAKGIDLQKIQFELDTGKERNKEERQQFAEMVLQQAGPAAIPWAMELLEAPNKEQLIEALQKNDAAAGLLAKLGEVSKVSGMPEEEIMQFMMQQLQAAAAPSPQGAPGAPGAAEGPRPAA